MPALNVPEIERLVVSNGLNVVLCSAVRLKRSAASLRVAAGSHDAPSRWPGLAHFLEHLFFLGTERFAAEQNLMRYVQGQGGQINASTRERTTDYFFELPAAALAGGVERLCDMLAHPRMDTDEQRREREVLHAEFIAWSRDAEARHQSALLARLDAQHPLRGFHAGNRYSLAVPNPAFQQALKDYYATFYQARQLTLCLSGPQSLDELRALAIAHGGVFRIGEKVAQAAPPVLGFDNRQQAGSYSDKTRQHILFACEQLPEKSDEAIAFLCHWLSSSKPGGLIAELQHQGLAGSLKAAPLYQFNGQLLLDVEFQGADSARQDTIAALFFSWLTFFKAHWPERVDEYNDIQQLRLQTCGALELAHHWCRNLPAGLSEGGAAALTTLLTRLSPESLLEPRTMPHLLAQPPEWHLPAPNPFLQAAPEPGTEAALFLRWELHSAQPALLRRLQDLLRGMIDDARQAGINLALTAHGRYWQLRLAGVQRSMALVVEHAMRTLRRADMTGIGQDAQADNDVPPIPIRQLLAALPDAVLDEGTPPDVGRPQPVWETARWTALAVGLSPANESAVNAALSLTPGLALETPVPFPPATPGQHWSVHGSGSAEDAVLVFCPAPDASIASEAAWRMLGHLMQGPFYQRLRVELQLGYAVFSGIRQIAGRTGLLFGAQSPACTAQELMQHIEGFIERLPELIASASVPEQSRALAAQFDPDSLPNEQLAELRWHAHLSGHGPEYFKLLRHAFEALDAQQLLDAADRLASAAAGWRVLSNRTQSLPER